MKNVDFSKRISKAREDRSLGPSELARLADVTPAAVWNWENNGTIPRSETLARVATVLGVTPNWLLTGKSGSEPPTAGRAQINLSDYPLEELMAAIDRKGFEVSVRPKTA